MVRHTRHYRDRMAKPAAGPPMGRVGAARAQCDRGNGKAESGKVAPALGWPRPPKTGGGVPPAQPRKRPGQTLGALYQGAPRNQKPS